MEQLHVRPDKGLACHDKPRRFIRIDCCFLLKVAFQFLSQLFKFGHPSIYIVEECYLHDQVSIPSCERDSSLFSYLQKLSCKSRPFAEQLYALRQIIFADSFSCEALKLC